MSENEKDRSPDELSQRLDTLKKQFGEPHKEGGAKQREGSSSDKAGIALAMRLSSEFIAGILVGGAIGYAVDAFFGTSPWGLIVFLLLGFCAAILNILRASGMVAESGLASHKEPPAAGLDQPTHDTQRNRAGQDR